MMAMQVDFVGPKLAEREAARHGGTRTSTNGLPFASAIQASCATFIAGMHARVPTASIRAKVRWPPQRILAPLPGW